MGKNEKSLCLNVDGTVSTGRYENPAWIHFFSLPDWCKRVFSASTKPVSLVFPVFHGENLRRFCLVYRDGIIETYSSKLLETLVYESMRLLEGRKGIGPKDVLEVFYRSLLSHYHEELTKADHEAEEIINKVMAGTPLYKPILRIYNRLSKMHRGVHGLIFSLNKLSRIIPDLKTLIDEAIMLENMYSTSIDRVTQAFNMYYTLISEKTNKVVTKLTVISAIFLPLSLIAGIYGMNFKYMPELQHPLGYPLTLTAMAIIAIGELIYFKRKKWI